MKLIKIFPVKLMSNYDILQNLCRIMPKQNTIKMVSKSDTAIINGAVKTLKKGRSICDMLSE
jgi:hypothetical protein